MNVLCNAIKEKEKSCMSKVKTFALKPVDKYVHKKSIYSYLVSTKSYLLYRISKSISLKNKSIASLTWKLFRHVLDIVRDIVLAYTVYSFIHDDSIFLTWVR